MTGSRLVRGTRSRLFLYVAVIIVVGLAVYVFHGAQLRLDDARKVADKCQQQQESLSAQLQVIFEYKQRLEKSLQQEKAEHHQTRDKLEECTKEDNQLKKENLEAINKYSALQQQYKLLQGQHEDLSEDCNKIRVNQLQGLEVRSKLESQVRAIQAELMQLHEAHEKSLESLKSQYMKLELERDSLDKQNKELLQSSGASTKRIHFLEKQTIQLQEELNQAQMQLKACHSDVQNRPNQFSQRVSVESEKNDKKVGPAPSPSSPSPVASSSASPVVRQLENQVLQEPSINHDNNSADKVLQRSTTPQINPDAVRSQDEKQPPMPVPAPRQEEWKPPNLPRPAMVEPEHHQNIPPGVVPAPQGFVVHRDKPDNGWQRYRHGPQPIQQLRNNPLDDNGPEIDEEHDRLHHLAGLNPINREGDMKPRLPQNGEEEQEIPRQMHHAYQNRDYDKEADGGGAGVRGGDLQLEDGDEDEEDDMDQIEYGNDAADGDRHHKQVPAPPPQPPDVALKHHDGVMVNPK